MKKAIWMIALAGICSLSACTRYQGEPGTAPAPVVVDREADTTGEEAPEEASGRRFGNPDRDGNGSGRVRAAAGTCEGEGDLSDRSDGRQPGDHGNHHKADG
ncbi:MAG: hypothetical protein ACLTKI_03950 [Lachnospiraceae bacterium]